jgi:GT2 family glycosyltransferase
MPVKNEEVDLRRAVQSVLEQNYLGCLEVCVAVAPSEDGTHEVAANLADGDSRIQVVENPSGITSAGLNIAIRATVASVIVRVDGHSELEAGYIAQAVETLEKTGAANVGGIQRSLGRTSFEHAVGRAMSSRFGAGDSRFHYGGAPGPVDTVYLGVFRREAIEAVGLFDESLVRNQDYELNWRLRRAGETIWFDPQLSVGYRPRGTIRTLARQYFEYGRWKRVVLRMHPKSLKVRHLVPPMAAVAFFLGLVIAPLFPWALILPLAYLLAVIVASLAAVRGQGLGQALILAAIYPTMHGSWGLGILVGPACTRSTGERRERG